MKPRNKETEMNHDVSIGEMIDPEDEARIGLLGRDPEIQFVRLAADHRKQKDELARLRALLEQGAPK